MLITLFHHVTLKHSTVLMIRIMVTQYGTRMTTRQIQTHYGYWFVHGSVSFFFLEYVETMKELLFGMTTAERNAVLARYTSREPKPLNSQFHERKNKIDAVKTYEVNKARKETAPFPSGILKQSFLM